MKSGGPTAPEVGVEKIIMSEEELGGLTDENASGASRLSQLVPGPDDSRLTLPHRRHPSYHRHGV